MGATSVFVELKGSLDELWGIEPPKGLAIIVFLRTRLHSFGLVLVLAFLLLVSLVLSAALAVLERYAGGIWSSSYDIFAILSSVIAFGVIGCLFAVIYKGLPDAPLSWRDVWIGAAFTAWPRALARQGRSSHCCYGSITRHRYFSWVRSSPGSTHWSSAASSMGRSAWRQLSQLAAEQTAPWQTDRLCGLSRPWK